MILKKSFMVASILGGMTLVAGLAGGCSSSKATDEGGTTEGGGGDTGTGGDTGVKKDTGTGGDSSMGPMCPTPLSDISGFMAPAMAIPPNPPSSACTSVQVTSYYTACLDANATQMTCSAWRMANMACQKCIESQDTDAKWGALVFGTGLYVTMGLVQANFDGCLIIEGATQCANDDFAANQCTKYACEMQCPVTDNASYAQYTKCETTASTGVCKTYSAKQQSSCALDSGAIAACQGSGFQDFFNKVALVMCEGGG